MTNVRITVNRNGSLKVEGAIDLVDADGNSLPTREGKPVHLCRCGGSTNKPFCDGTHSKIGFIGAEAAVDAATKAVREAEAGGESG
ncbi:MAG: CDGSH iron-sulfur domain-containing protein [Gemmatimonadales bacterium]|nr:MAG: CDGSH iron-sulfur domain-containing protein [Gemmatimonadales bacterium]